MLEDAIKHFLNATCQLTPRWFNKPKFHLLVHLPDHIRRFGPPMLFATEGFESYNAIIRAHSVHSNRHAPSRDIARSMARANRLRHLLSGGHFRAPPGPVSLSASHSKSSDETQVNQNILRSPWLRNVTYASGSRWIAIGDEPRRLLHQNNFSTRLYNFPPDNPSLSDIQPAGNHSIFD